MNGFKTIEKESIIERITSEIEMMEARNHVGDAADGIDENANHTLVDTTSDSGRGTAEIRNGTNSIFSQFQDVTDTNETSPVAEDSAERIFSNAHNLITERRTRLTPANVDMLVFLHKNA